MFAEFEKITHGLQEQGETLTADRLCEIYYDLNKLYFGEEICVDQEIAMEWARIPHFYTPFYVYQYATGFSAAIALSKQILEQGAPAVEQYKKFLKGGSSMYPLELLKMAGVDMEQKAPVQMHLRYLHNISMRWKGLQTMTLYEAIFRRKSIRKYRDTEIDPKLLEKIEQYGEDAVGIRPEIRTKWKILKGSDKRLAGLFLVKAPYYVVLYSEICEDYRKNAGCLMEQLVLYLHTKGIGSCYQGGARVKHEDEKELEPVMIMAFGYPAEPLERDREAFKRMELNRFVKVHGNFGKVQRKLLEAARVAPSAMNLQPWRFVVTDGKIHMFVKKPGKIGYQMQQDFNLFDAGIALAHMLVTAEEQWFDLEYQKLDSILEKDFPNNMYVGSLLILNESEKI